MTPVRCAIYTRKSSEDGLEQGFNSLHAQREACAAYILSQASEGWTLLPEEYDDGGLSGGTLERPALQRLLGDVAAGKIDIIVVYKVDRLTRSLLDFAKLVEALDKARTSFVSITQSFNTTTSMGRLTLNMLLSFAQFEREVTAERIRDKVAASKAKGMWMGGTPPLGYRPEGRSLAIIAEHADLVRHIYARYLALGAVRLLQDELAAAGTTTPPRTSLAGRPYGGGPFSRGQLYAILRNPIYVGEIVHKGQHHAGLHEPIIARELWDKVQRQLTSKARGHRRKREASPSLLAGRLVDAAGEPLIASHACKGARRYRYYVSKALHHGTLAERSSGRRIPAEEIEQVVTSELALLFDDPLGLAERCGVAIHPAELKPLLARAGKAAADLRADARGLLRKLITQVQVHDARIEIGIDQAAAAAALGSRLPPGAPAVLSLTSEVRLTRTGRAVRLVEPGGSTGAPGQPDLALIRLVARARAWWGLIASGQAQPAALATAENVTVSWLLRVLRLAFLSPAVIEALLAGALKPEIDSTALIATGAIPLDWAEQERRFVAGA